MAVVLGLYWDNGKENGNYYLGFISPNCLEKYVSPNCLVHCFAIVLHDICQLLRRGFPEPGVRKMQKKNRLISTTCSA